MPATIAESPLVRIPSATRGMVSDTIAFMRNGLIRLLAALAAVAMTACLSGQPAGPDSAAGATGIRAFVFPDESEDILLDAIRNARSRVLLTTYLMTDLRVIDALVRARASGAETRVLLEQSPFGGGVAAKSTFERLEKAGIPVKPGAPAFRFTHQKSMVIDETAYVLTANMTRAAFSANREFGLVTTNADDVAEIARAFDADWNRTAFTPSSPRLIWSPVNSRARINAVIGSAARALDIYAEVVQDNDQVARMADAARRGARVRLIIPPTSDGDTAAPSDDLARLRAAGVQVRRLKAPTQHAKVMLADGALAFVGSQNVTATSLDLNRELGMLIADPGVLKRLAASFEADWAKGADR